jgi:hypothetical protein
MVRRLNLLKALVSGELLKAPPLFAKGFWPLQALLDEGEESQ